MVLIDEAHNCGDTIQSIESVGLAQKDLEQAIRELFGHETPPQGGRGGAARPSPAHRVNRGLANSTEPEDSFDPGIFHRMIVKGSLWKDMDEIVDELMGLAETIRDRNQKAGEFRETAIERLTVFVYRLSQSAHNPAYLTIYKKTEEGIILR